jgi:hypothetical protein
MREIFAAVLKIASPDHQSLQGDVGTGHQPVNQPAAHSVEETRKELSLGEMSGAACSLVPDEHSVPWDIAQEATPLSHGQKVSIRQQFVESHATLIKTEDFVDVGHLGSTVSVGEALDQVQNVRDNASVQSSSLSQEVPRDLNLQIARKLQEFQQISKELGDLLLMAKAQKGTVEEKSRIEQTKMTDSNGADAKNDKSTVAEIHIKEHSDTKKTKFVASKVTKNPALYVCAFWTSLLYKKCRQLQVLCERVSSILPSTIDSFLLAGIMNPAYARPHLHLAEATSLFIGFSFKLHSTMGHLTNNISGCNVKEVAHLLFALRELIIIFPVLEAACRNFYYDYLQDFPSGACQTSTDDRKLSHAQIRSKMDMICHQMDMAYEQLGKAIGKINIIRDNEAASSKISLHPLRAERDSRQVDPKEIFYIISRKLLLINHQITSLMKTRKFHAHAE